MARPSSYEPEVAFEICRLIATTARGLDYICKSKAGLPSSTTVHNWLNAHPEFLEAYLRAREMQADLIFDECLEIADFSANDTFIDNDTGETKVDGDVIQRAKLRVDTRMRMAGKLSPKKYGDSTTIKGDKENPLQIELASRLDQAMIARRDPIKPEMIDVSETE